MMENRTVELIVVSAEGLKNVKSFGKQSCYAVAYIYPNQKRTSKVDYIGGVNPSWNSKLILSCDDTLFQRPNAYITVEIFSRGSFGDKLVGTSKIQLQDVANEGKNAPKSMAFQVRRPSGKVKGVLNVSVKLIVKAARQNQAQGNNKQNGWTSPVAAYPPSNYTGPYPPQKTNYGEKVHSTTPYPPPKANYGGKVDSTTPNPPPKTSYGGKVDSTAPYPPPKANFGTAAPADVYPPQAEASAPSYSSGGSSSSVYPPQSSSAMQEPVLAYPAPGYSPYGQLYPPPYSQRYYPPPQASAPYNYQEAYYSKPPKRNGGSGMGMGLLGGALGGLLLGDIIGDMGGF